MTIPLHADYGRTVILRTDTLQEVRARPRTLDLVSIFTKYPHVFLSRERIHTYLQGYGEEVSDKNVDVAISMARKPLALLGIEIVNQARVGWRLELTGDSAITINLPSVMRNRLVKLATSRNCTIDEAVRQLLEEHL